MSGISSGIGLISGINTAELINQLMAIEARPVNQLQKRVGEIDARRAAFLALSAQLLAIRNAVTNFGGASFFKRFSATSSDESVATAKAGEAASSGSIALRVHSLVSQHALVSRGFADADRTALGVGTLTIESARARVNPDSELDSLNGGRGVRRGFITISDRSGTSARIDLTRALTVSDVLDAINTNPALRVRASVTGIDSAGGQGDRIIIEDFSGGTGDLVVTDDAGAFTAADLGIVGRFAANRIDGANLIRLDLSTLLRTLNDGNGVDRLRQGATSDDLIFVTSQGEFGVSLSDFLDLDTDLRALNNGNGVRLGMIRITDRSGRSAEVDLTAARTVREVQEAINNSGVAVSATTVNSRILISDLSDAPDATASNLKIEDVTGYAAADLGIMADVAADAINGKDVYRVATVGDVIRGINFAWGNDGKVQASLAADGKRIVLRALTSGGTVTVRSGVDSTGVVSRAALDLGLNNATFTADTPWMTRALTGGLNTVLLHSLNGGRGVGLGEVSITDASGRTSHINFSAATTLRDVIDLINADETVSVVASINPAGNGITISDESGGSGPVLISDVVGTLAADLNIAGSHSSSSVMESGNLQRQYVSRATPLSQLNGGRGVTSGTIRINATTGAVYTVHVLSNMATVGSVIDAINLVVPDTIEARINDTGDGIVVVDQGGGDRPLTIEEVNGGRTAADLRLAGAASAGAALIDGSFETRIEIGAADTLSTLAARINQSQGTASASVISDGGSVNPFSLTITSSVSGRRGALIVDALGVDLGLSTLAFAQDAVVSVGAGGGQASLLVTSSKNSLDDVLPGVTIDLLQTSPDVVSITTNQDVDGIIESIRTFVQAYNNLQSAIDEQTRFDPDTLQRGTLFGDPTVDQIRSRLHRVIMRPFAGVDASVSRLFSVGLRLGAGNRLQFDEEQFREVYERTPELVEQLFTQKETGFGAVIQDTLDELTRDFDGLLARKDELLNRQQELLNDRIGQLNVLLDGRRRRLQAQFAGLESALAALQDQQNSLLALSQLVSSS